MARYDRYDRGFRPYVPVAERRRQAEKELKARAKDGHVASPVVTKGRAIAATFWGKAWCDNLESYSDYANRLPRGRTYVRNGSVVDLQITPGRITALVSGSELYEIGIEIKPVPTPHWEAVRRDCAGAIDSLVELLQGRLSKGVMERVCQRGAGLFPAPKEITLACSCPDAARMCKHVAAVLYGVGTRLDERPELLFVLREVDAAELVSQAAAGLPLTQRGTDADRILTTSADDDLAALFGLDLGGDAAQPVASPPSKSTTAKRRRSASPAAVKPASRTKKSATPSAKASSKSTAKAPSKASAKSSTTASSKASAKSSTTAPSKASAKSSPKTAGKKPVATQRRKRP